MITRTIATLALAVSIGATGGTSPYWQQQTQPDCVEQATRIAMDTTGHHHYTEAQIDAVATAEGLYSPGVGSAGGTILWSQLFRHYHVPAAFGTHSYTTVATDIAKGDTVIAVINAETIWAPQGYHTTNPTTTADHALIIKTVRPSTVTLVDTGIPTGNGETVSRTLFSKAWAASGYQTVVVTR